MLDHKKLLASSELKWKNKEWTRIGKFFYTWCFQKFKNIKNVALYQLSRKLAFLKFNAKKFKWNYFLKLVTHTNGNFISYPFLLFELKIKSSSSLSLLIFLLALRSPFFDDCCCFWELSGLLVDGLVDLMGVPNRCIFCFLCFFSCAFLALSGDSKPCSIILQTEFCHASQTNCSWIY